MEVGYFGATAVLSVLLWLLYRRGTLNGTLDDVICDALIAELEAYRTDVDVACLRSAAGDSTRERRLVTLIEDSHAGRPLKQLTWNRKSA